jgi:hypothetical protein
MRIGYQGKHLILNMGSTPFHCLRMHLTLNSLLQPDCRDAQGSKNQKKAGRMAGLKRRQAQLMTLQATL